MPVSSTVAALITILGALAAHDEEIAAFVRMLIAGHSDAQRQLETALPVVSESQKAEERLTAQHDTDPAPKP